MKKKIFLLIAVFIILNSSFLIHNCFSQWVQMSSGMGNNKYVHSLATNGNNIFAGLWGDGVFISTNNGENWTQTTLNNKYVSSLALSGNFIFAGTSDNGVYLSTNSGQSWTQTSLNNIWVSSLAINGNNIFAGTYQGGIFISANNGQTWTQTSLNNREIFSITISGNNIFVGTNSYGVYLSTNNGQSWTQTALNNKSVFSLISSGNNIFAGTPNNGVYLTSNNGQTWTQTSLNNAIVSSLATSGNNIFAGTHYNGVYYTTNNGINWTQKNEGFNPSVGISSLLIANDYIFAGTGDQSVWRRPLSDFTGIQIISTEIPSAFSLGQNYPNPFNAVTSIKFKVTSASPYPLQRGTSVMLKVYDLNGREIRTLVNEELNPGIYEVRFDAGNLPSGIYFYRMETEKFTETKKLILLK